MHTLCVATFCFLRACACVRASAGSQGKGARACAIGKWLKKDGGDAKPKLSSFAEAERSDGRTKEVWLHLLLLRRCKAGNRCASENDHTDIK